MFRLLHNIQGSLYRHCLFILLIVSHTSYAEFNQEELTLLDDISDLKQQVLTLNRDLFILEEELLFPANTQISVFVSLDAGNFFTLESVELKMNDKTIASHLYTEAQIDALKRGGMQRLYIGNIKTGEHQIVALFTGIGPHDRAYRRATEFTFNKETDPIRLAIEIQDSQAKQQPSFNIVNWDKKAE